MSAVTDPSPYYRSALPLRQRFVILIVVIIAHGVLLSQSWLSVPALSVPAMGKLSVSIVRKPELQQQPASQTNTLPQVPQHKPDGAENQKPKPALRQHDTEQTMMPGLTKEPEQLEPPALPDREPDYRAAYLHNPQPAYPLSARRMGWQGRVVLSVEVLADGTPGHVTIQQGSGHDVLDNAALRAVRGWRFAPARRGGVHVAQQLLVPLVFDLKEAE